MSYSPYITAQATFASPYSSCEASFDSPLAELDEVLTGWPALSIQDYVLPVRHDAGLGHITYTGTQLDYMSSARSHVDQLFPWSPELSFSASNMKSWDHTPSLGQCSSPPSMMCTPPLISGGLLDATYSPLSTMYSSSSDSGLESWNDTPSQGQYCNSPHSAIYIEPLIGGGPLDSTYGSPSTGYSNTDVNTCNDTYVLNNSPSSQVMHISDRARLAPTHNRPRTKTSKKKPSTQRRGCPPHTKHKHASPASPSSAKLVSAARRLAQVTAPYVALPASARTCPICGYTPPPNNAERELKRHHTAHFPTADEEARFVCNGVSVDNAARYGVQDADAAVVQGEVRVGRFCLMKFGRRDALLRHVRNPNIACVCDVLPAEVYRGTKLF